ncbi:transcriptional regulator [Nonomuraea sp. NBC_01738]|uniref:helix-turn-helix transcriptional regulator n=1 Tax=Nonomuraea sp. NBC_01738 TaxID=2976003 RepID=UPI002E14F964|nr:transcriptional regulator [Nonomuraea sp. NBC_01738]
MDEDGLRAAVALGDGLRRRMYEFVRRAPEPVTRDEAAGHVGISRKLAAFHLDKLVEAELLTAGYGRPGPRGVGRAPKVYLPSGRDVRVSIPQREHGLLAAILLDAVRLQDEGESASGAALRVARRQGTALGSAERDRLQPGRLGPERALTCAAEALERHGFEPERAGPTLTRLANCPFHPLASRDPELVCGINHAFLSGFLDGLEAGAVTASLVPRPGACCVELGVPDQEDR